ncbi:MAG: hypothetical protein LBG97_10440 [Coriobacteriales bacterium]|nr:hypothetical protein [Coriobacteriales bacterium]
MLVSLVTRIRIDASNPIGAIIIAIIVVAAATGIVYAFLDFLFCKVILGIMGVPEERRNNHFLSKLAIIISLLVLLYGIAAVILPVFNIDTGIVNILNIIE